MTRLPEDLQECFNRLSSMEDVANELLQEIQQPMSFADLATVVAKVHGLLRQVSEDTITIKDRLEAHDCDENADHSCPDCDEKDEEIDALRKEVEGMEGAEEVIEQVRVILQIRSGAVHPTFLTFELDKLDDLVRGMP